MPVRNLLTISAVLFFSLACYFRADRNRYASTLAEAMNLIEANYVEKVDPRALYEHAMQGLASSLDANSRYISPRDYRHLLEGLDQQFGGIGILVEVNREKKRLMVLKTIIDTPAYAAGIKASDLILKIDDRDTLNVSVEVAADLMRGKPGTTVTLSVLHTGEEAPVDLTLTRAVIPIESVLGDEPQPDGGWSFQLESHPRVTYIRLIKFGERTAEELSKILAGRSVEALILDLRDNSGGLLTGAVSTCDLFLERGAIVSTRGRQGRAERTFHAGAHPLLDRDVPMVVLTNQFTASASEIVAACLQDHGRAKIVGQRTFGKGTVQNVLELEGGRAALKLTTASYWRPSGKNIQRRKDAGEDEDWGVRPDAGFEVVLTDEELKRLRQQRRDRDLLLIPEPGAEPSPKGSAAPPGPVDDRQLRKAAEYIEKQLRQSDARRGDKTP
jgi:carboxyl-terminal processing protease